MTFPNLFSFVLRLETENNSQPANNAVLCFRFRFARKIKIHCANAVLNGANIVNVGPKKART